MNRKIFTALIIISVFLPATLGVCYGNNKNFVPAAPASPENQSSPRCILAGDLTDSRLKDSDLTPYLTGKITENLDLSDIKRAISVIESLTSRDFIFFSDADKNILEKNSGLFYKSLTTAHEKGVIIAAVYPDSADIDAIETILSEHHNQCLSEPHIDAKDPHFEVIAVALRYLPDGMPHTFVYVDDSDTNYGEMVDFQELSDDVSISGDHTGDESESVITLNPEEIEADLHVSRVENLFIWADSLESELQSAADDMRTAVIKLKSSANTNDEIQKLVTGLTTTKADNVSWSFADYYNKFGKNNKNFKIFAEKCGFDNPETLKKYWGKFKISRNTFSQYRAVSFHSFKNHCDYFLVMSRADTQPKNIVTAANQGTAAQKEIPGAGSVILGSTSGLFTRIERITKSGGHVYYMPDQTVNKNKSAAKWTGQDYEIIPQPNGNLMAQWYLKVDNPAFKDGWRIPKAAKDSVTLNTESIWEAADRKFKVRGRAIWQEGFSWHHDSSISGEPSYYCAVTHSGGWVNISLPRPSRIALEKTSESGTREGKLYSAKLYADVNWTAESDSNWITLKKTSGGESAGTDFYYTVAPNETGSTRTGHITIDSGKLGNVTLEFVQSAY